MDRLLQPSEQRTKQMSVSAKPRQPKNMKCTHCAEANGLEMPGLCCGALVRIARMKYRGQNFALRDPSDRILEIIGLNRTRAKTFDACHMPGLRVRIRRRQPMRELSLAPSAQSSGTARLVRRTHGLRCILCVSRKTRPA